MTRLSNCISAGVLMGALLFCGTWAAAKEPQNPSPKANSAIAAKTHSTSAESKKTRSSKKIATAEQAVALIKQRKDVKEFLALFPAGKGPKTGGTPVVEAEKQDGKWLVHVYEALPDHTATHNWYTVDPVSGSVTPMF